MSNTQSGASCIYAIDSPESGYCPTCDYCYIRCSNKEIEEGKGAYGGRPFRPRFCGPSKCIFYKQKEPKD